MAQGLFIDENYVKEMSYLDENVDVNLIRPVIAEAQEMRILPLIGTGLYNEITAQIVAGTLTALNTTLINSYLAKSLKYWTLCEGVDILTYKFTNKTILKRTSESGNTIELTDIKRLIAKFQDKAEWYDQRAIRYLCENSASYPLYLNAGNTSDTIHPKGISYSTGLFLGGVKKPIDIADLYENPRYYNS